MDYILKTHDLHKSYRKFNALNGLTMSVPKGSIYGLVGMNGAGKTTLIRIAAGLQYPTSGDLELFGTSCFDDKIVDARKRIGTIVETPSLHPEMTAEENLKMQFISKGLPNYDEIPKLLEFVGLKDTGTKKAKKFSLGMRQRLSIAMTLCGDPDMLILDEPINGLDPQGIIEVRELILKLNREKDVTILISSHILDELSRLATHYCFIDKGVAVKEISAEELERSCNKSLYVEVKGTGNMSVILDRLGYEYKLMTDRAADIFGDVDITPLVMELHKNGMDISKINEKEESLESFFLSVVGGGHND